MPLENNERYCKIMENGSLENEKAVDKDGVSCKYTKNPSGILNIRKLSKDDVGNFTCIVNTELNLPKNITHFIIDDLPSTGGLVSFLEKNILPIVIGIIILALVIILLSIVCLRRRRNKCGRYSPEKEKVCEHLGYNIISTKSNSFVSFIEQFPFVFLQSIFRARLFYQNQNHKRHPYGVSLTSYSSMILDEVV